MRISDWSSDVCSSDLRTAESCERRGCSHGHADDTISHDSAVLSGSGFRIGAPAVRCPGKEAGNYGHAYNRSVDPVSPLGGDVDPPKRNGGVRPGPHPDRKRGVEGQGGYVRVGLGEPATIKKTEQHK